MSDTEKQYTLTLTQTELDFVREAVTMSDWNIYALAESILPALDAAKPVKPRAPKALEPEAGPFEPDTGNRLLDEWLVSHHHADWRARLANALKPRRVGMMPMPAPAPGFPRRVMTQQERADLYRVHVIRSAHI